MNLSQYVLLSEKSFQTVLITTIKEEIFKFNIRKWLTLDKQMTKISAVHN